MTQESKLIAKWPFCVCGSDKVISVEAFKTAEKELEGFSALRREVVPIEQPILSAVSVTAIVTSYDVCYECGLERATRSELVKLPVQAQPMPGRKGPGQGPGFMPGPFRSSS